MNRERHAQRSRPTLLRAASGSHGEHPAQERGPRDAARPTAGSTPPSLRRGFEHGRRMVEVRASAIAAVRGSLRS